MTCIERPRGGGGKEAGLHRDREAMAGIEPKLLGDRSGRGGMRSWDYLVATGFLSKQDGHGRALADMSSFGCCMGNRLSWHR